MNKEYLDNFENRLQQELLRLSTAAGMLNGQLLASDDIDGRWHELAPHYMADAVPQIRDYPTVSVAWAAYLGLAVAHGWDTDWAATSQAAYQSYYGPQGFDDMDEHIVQQLLGLLPEGYEVRQLESLIRRCGETTVTLIRHERIEPQSPMAFHVFARACKVMFRLGAALELKRLGYKFEKLN
ncbi:MAG: hypothetical protein IJ494_06630 [Bacteroides sp.]|nr:hypothetical protein [Bacteroides sp.]